MSICFFFFFFQAEDGIRDGTVTGVQTCALPIFIAENTARLGKTLFTEKKGGDPVTLLSTADERDEAEWLANEFARRAADGDVAYEGMAILYRTNAQSRPLEEAFRFRGIPYRLIGAISFYERREVKDLLGYLRLIANPADDEAFLRVVNVPRRGIGDASLALLGRAAAGWQKPLLEAARRGRRSRIPTRRRAPAHLSSATSLRPPSSRPWTRIRTSPASRSLPRTWPRDSSGRSSRSRVWRMDCFRSVARPNSRAASKRSDDCVTWVSRARAKGCISHGRARGIATAGWSSRRHLAFSTRCRRRLWSSGVRRPPGSLCAPR